MSRRRIPRLSPTADTPAIARALNEHIRIGAGQTAALARLISLHVGDTQQSNKSHELAMLTEIHGTTPEFRFRETDQTAPAGEYRMGSVGDNFVMARSGAANFGNTLGSASDFSFLEYNRSNTYLSLFATESDSWYIRLDAGAGAGTQSAIYVQGHATAPRIELRTGNAAGSNVARMIVRGGTGSPDIDITTATLDLNGNVTKGLATMRGEGTSDIFFRANKATTDATARRIGLWVLDPATDTEYTVANAVPDAAVPKFTMAAPDDAPSTTELDADHITFGYTKATDTLNVYVNEGGAIKTLALGVLV